MNYQHRTAVVAWQGRESEDFGDVRTQEIPRTWRSGHREGVVVGDLVEFARCGMLWEGGFLFCVRDCT